MLIAAFASGLVLVLVLGTYVVEALLWLLRATGFLLYHLGAVLLFLVVLAFNPPEGMRLWRQATIA